MKIRMIICSLGFLLNFQMSMAQQDSVNVENDTLVIERVIIDEDFDEEEEEVESGIVKKKRRTRNNLNFDLGLNNYLENGNFPDNNDKPYTLKPLGSWYFAVSSVNSTLIGGPLYLEWGMGASWYNFKLQDPQIRITKGLDNIEFNPDLNGYDRYIKSKLSVTYLNVFFVPVFRMDDEGRKNKGFRIGLGGYAGYRIGSKTKFVYEIDKKQKEKSKGNFYLNNVRYGCRLQLGWKGTDVFFNYDLNNLFIEGKGPELNPFSFGIIF